MLSDFHVHTCFSADSDCPPIEQAARAAALGMEEMCVTDHIDAGQVTEEGRVFEFDPDDYLAQMRRLREEFSDRFTLRIGVELGLDPDHEETVRSFPGRAPFDYVIGSVHVVDGMDPYYPHYFEVYPDEAGIRRYFEVCLDCVRRFEDYDCFGHLDYILRYAPRLPADYPDAWRELTDPILRRLAETGHGLEFNTASLRRGMVFGNPHPQLLSRYRELGGEILCVGSDAHRSRDLGADFGRAREILLACGFRYYTTFAERKPLFHRL